MQVSYWFVNARKRLWKPYIKDKEDEDVDVDTVQVWPRAHCSTSCSFLYISAFLPVCCHKIMQLDGNTNFSRDLPANLPPFPQRLHDNMAALLGTVGLDRERCSLQSHADTEVQPSIHPGVAPTFEHRSFCPCAAAS